MFIMTRGVIGYLIVAIGQSISAIGIRVMGPHGRMALLKTLIKRMTSVEANRENREAEPASK